MELSSGIVAKRIGIVHGAPLAPAAGPAAQSLGQMLRVLDRLSARYALSLETQPVEGLLPPRNRLVEYASFLLGGTVAAQPWLRELGGPSLVAAPFLASREAAKSSLLLWNFEDANRMRTGRGGGSEAWIETSCLSRLGVEFTLRAAQTQARERSGAAPIWAFAGWGETEEFCLSVAQKLGVHDLRIVPIEQLSLALADPVYAQGAAVVALGRTALPLARWLGAQGWVSWSEHGGLIGQASSAAGALLTLSTFLDRMGFLNEAQELERLTRARLRPEGGAAAPAGEELINQVVEKLG